MRSLLILCLAISVPCMLVAQGQYPSFPPPPTNTAAPPPINLTITPNNLPAPIQPVSGNTGSVKPGDKVMVIRGTYIRSGPGEQAYPCEKLEAGTMVTILDYPSPGSEYTPIAAPENCYSLIPLSSVHHSWAMWVDVKKLMNQPQKTLEAVETLIFGDAPNGNYLASGYKLPKGSLVTIRDEKKIKINGKEKVYCVILAGGKEKRFVRTADLEGVAASAQAERANQQTSPSMNSPLYGSQRNPNEPWPPGGTVQQATIETDQLPGYLLSQVQAADQAYKTAMHYGAWEDARQRYLALLQADVVSVRILAKNRLEFISEMQRNPPVVTTSMSQKQDAAMYPPTFNREPWVPGSQAPARPATPVYPTNSTLPVKDVVIRSAPPASAPASNPVNIPVYPGANAQQQPVQNTRPPANNQMQIQPQNPAVTAPTSQRVVQRGRLYPAAQFDGLNRLFFLTNSQGNVTHYLRAVTTSGVRLADYQGRYVEVEGNEIQAYIDGKQKLQINVDRIKPLQ